jgi:hypothetical protein
MRLAKLVSCALVALVWTGCSSTETYDVTGDVTAAQQVSGPIVLEFFALDGSDSAAERESVLKVELSALGPYDQQVDVTPGFKIIARAIADADGDGKCTAGELWDEGEVLAPEEPETGAKQKIDLALAAQPCPTETATPE